MDEEVTLDNWEPSKKEPKLIQSKWRQEQINNNYNQEVGRDDIKKIQAAIQKKFPDHQIMQTYGISAQTLIDIKERRLNPEAGKTRGSLSMLNDLTDINGLAKKISAIQTRLYGITCAFRALAKILFEDKETQDEFIKLLEKKRGKPKATDKEEDED